MGKIYVRKGVVVFVLGRMEKSGEDDKELPVRMWYEKNSFAPVDCRGRGVIFIVKKSVKRGTLPVIRAASVVCWS